MSELLWHKKGPSISKIGNLGIWMSAWHTLPRNCCVTALLNESTMKVVATRSYNHVTKPSASTTRLFERQFRLCKRPREAPNNSWSCHHSETCPRNSFRVFLRQRSSGCRFTRPLESGAAVTLFCPRLPNLIAMIDHPMPATPSNMTYPHP